MTGNVAGGLGRFLTAEFGETVAVSNIRQLSVGARRRTIAFDAQRRGHCRRLVATFVPGPVRRLPVDVEAETRELARKHGVPVPPIVATCTDPEYVGAPFLVAELVDGETLPRKVFRLVRAAGIGERLTAQLGKAMGRLHAIDPHTAPAALPTAAEFPGATTHFTPTSPTADPVRAHLAAVEGGVADLPLDRPVFDLALCWLRDRVPGPPARKVLLHNDMRTGNLIVDGDGLRAVLDWEEARRFGDPMRDVARAALRVWRFGNDRAEFGGFAGREPFRHGYEQVGGVLDIERFRWWTVLLTLELGLDLAAEAVAGTGADARRLAELEWDLLGRIRPESRRPQRDSP
ncbi:phosphotransferase family protein [Nocardia sp. NPDC003482]